MSKEPKADVSSVGYGVWLVVSILMYGFQSLTIEALQPELDGEKAATLVEVFLRTAPLTTAVALVALAWWRDWFDGVGNLIFAAVVLVSTTALANWAGHSSAAGISAGQALEHANYGFQYVLANLLVRYAYSYGPGQTLSSLILGGFIAWIWSERILSPLLAVRGGESPARRSSSARQKRRSQG